MTITSNHILGAAAALCSTAFVAWRVSVASTPQPVPHAAILYDRSDSMPADCGALVGLADEVLDAAPYERGSTLTVFATGEPASAHEPILVGTYGIPIQERVLEGRRGVEQRRTALLADLADRCAALQPTGISPILQGLLRAMQHLEAQGCDASHRCILGIRSDATETVEDSLAKRLRGTAQPNPGEADAPLRSINNSGTRIEWCDLSATRRTEGNGGKRGSAAPPRTAADVARLRDVWTAMFQEPHDVRFRPHCPRRAVAPTCTAVAEGVHP